jgi:hypothetical protein
MSEAQQYELEARRETVADLLRVRTADAWVSFGLTVAALIALVTVVELFWR